VYGVGPERGGLVVTAVGGIHVPIVARRYLIVAKGGPRV